MYFAPPSNIHSKNDGLKYNTTLAIIKHKKGLEKYKPPQVTSSFQWHGRNNGEGVGCLCLVTKAQHVQECITMLVSTC